MGLLPRSLIVRVVGGILVFLFCFYFKQAHAQTCPSGQVAKLTILRSVNSAGFANIPLDTAVTPPTPAGLKTLFEQYYRPGDAVGARQWCASRINASDPPFVYADTDAARNNCTGDFGPYASVNARYSCETACRADQVKINGVCQCEPPKTEVAGICQLQCNKPADTLKRSVVHVFNSSPASYCEQSTNCFVQSRKALSIDENGAGEEVWNEFYTGQNCTTQVGPSANPLRESNTVNAGGQSFKLSNGTFSVVKWVNNGKDVTLPITDNNGQTANADNSFVRNSNAQAKAPSGAQGPITVTTYNAAGQPTSVNVYVNAPTTINNNNARYQSGGEAGGGGPPNKPAPMAGDTTVNGSTTSTVTNVTMNNTSTTVTTTNYNSVTNNYTTTTTTTTPNSSTSTTSPPVNGAPPNGPPPRKPPKTDGPDCSGPDCNSDDDCTGDDCDGDGGGSGAFHGKGGTAKTFSESTSSFTSRLNASPIATAMAGISDGIPTGGQCPTVTFSALNHTFSIDAHCPLLDQFKSIISAVFLFGWALYATLLFFKA